ncbi:hypothetical protein [Ruegeria halocynthiae]|uniref:hypothetical protein n=1 Tax=Ruegeria halocynthiae TaxID=985054 RepID=UPI00055A9291|nr:hypothetical protein [Ruegeria halocynthiae]
MPEHNAVLRQEVFVDSRPSGAVCDIYSLDKKIWKKNKATKAHRNDVALTIGKKDEWYAGIPLSAVPQGSEALLTGMQLPATFKVKRTTDFLITECKHANGKSSVRGYTYQGNPSATAISLADPTFVGVDLIAGSTGYAYRYPNEVIIPLQ